MKGRIVAMMVALVTIAVLVGNLGKPKAQEPGMPSPKLYEFYREWFELLPMAAHIPALLSYNEKLYEHKQVTADECVKFDEAIGTIASVLKKAWAGIKNVTLREELQLVTDNYINASKLYADYHKTGKEKLKDKADEELNSAGKHWAKASKYLKVKR